MFGEERRSLRELSRKRQRKTNFHNELRPNTHKLVLKGDSPKSGPAIDNLYRVMASGTHGIPKTLRPKHWQRGSFLHTLESWMEITKGKLVSKILSIEVICLAK